MSGITMAQRSNIMYRYIDSIWRCRYFWTSLVKMDLRTRYRRSVLGIGWSMLQPIAMTAILCLIFAKIFNVSVREYAPYLLAGLSFWNFFVGCAIGGCQSFYQAETYIRQFPTPLAIYPLRVTLGAMFHLLIALTMVLAFTWIDRGFGNIPALSSFVPTLAILFVLGWSVAMITGFANVYFPDTQHMIEVGLQLMFYATPIMYLPGTLTDKGLGWIVTYNPLSQFLALVREPLLYGAFPTLQTITISSIATAIVAAVAVGVLSSLQRKLIFHL